MSENVFSSGDEFIGTVDNPFGDGFVWGVIKPRHTVHYGCKYLIGPITGDPEDLYESYYDERFQPPIHYCSWEEACRRKRDFLLKEVKEKGTSIIELRLPGEWKLYGGGTLQFDTNEIINQLNAVIDG